MEDHIAVQLVMRARAGDQAALDELMTHYLPLVYNIVGRALLRHGDVDDVVQNTMLAAVRGIDGLREPASFRSWLVAITMNQLRHHARQQPRIPTSSLDDSEDLADPGADFVDLTLMRLGLSGQRREVVLATRWLDPDDRRLLSLWWLETAGQLTRADLAGALELDPHHATVRLARMKNQLETARLIVRALMESPRCMGLRHTAEQWRGQENPLWRKRFARHVRECSSCTNGTTGLIPAEGLLAGLALVPIPVGYAASMLAAVHHVGTTAIAVPRVGRPTAVRPHTGRLRGGGRHSAAHAKIGLGLLSPKPLLAAVVPLMVGGGVAVAAVYPTASGTQAGDAAPNRLRSAPPTGGTPSQPGPAGSTDPGTSAQPSPTLSPTPSPSRSTPHATPPSPTTTSSRPRNSSPGNPPSTSTPSTHPPTTSPTPAPPTTSPAANDPDAAYYDHAVQQVFQTMNDARAKVGVPPLKLIPGLNTSASKHTQLMAHGCGLNHVCPGEPNIGLRFYGVSWGSAGENIGDGNASDTDSSITGMAVGLTLGMLAEQPPNDGHKWDILTKDHTGVGIAVFRDSHGILWMTQDFVG